MYILYTCTYVTKSIKSSVHSHFQMDLNRKLLITSRLPLREIKLLCNRYNSGICKGRMVPCCLETWSQCTETKCYHVIKFDQLNAPLLLRHDKKAIALWLVYFFGCFIALIAMSERQNWHQSVFWQVHALSF